MGKKVSKNSRVNRGGGGKDFIKVVVSEKNEETGAYVYKDVMVHKDNIKEFLKNQK